MIFESQDEDLDECSSGINVNDSDATKLELSDTVNEPESKLKRNKFNWVENSKWKSLDDVTDFLDSEGFVVFDDKDLQIGQKFYFRCMRIPKNRKRHEWCSRRFVVFLPSDSNEIILQTNNEEHSHDELMQGKKRPISPEMLEFIHDLYKMGTTKHTTVSQHIEQSREKYKLFQNEPNPTIRQLEYCLKKYNARGVGKMIHLGDLAKWCESRSALPEGKDDAFVLSHHIDATKHKQGFGFCIATLNLLERLSELETICIDATYKLNWMGFPLIVLGTVDRNKKFHPLLYGCSSHETTEDYAFIFQSVMDGIEKIFPQANFQPKKLIADGADAIRNAFYLVFEKSAEIDIMCFAHVIRNVRKRPFASKNNKPLIVDDIKKMQLAYNKSEFEMMKKLFIEKWNKVEPDFVSYFQREWLGTHSNWYEGAAHYTPSTNNALESHNAVIKRTITFRRRLPLGEFLNAMITMTGDASKQFTEGKRVYAMVPDISREIMMRAAEIYHNGFDAFKGTAKSSGRCYYVLPAEKCLPENATNKYYKILTKKVWKSFDEFITFGYQMFWLMNFSNDDWKMKSTCTCPVFFKQFICKHIVAIALKLEIIECPVSSNPLLIAPRKKPGRPKNSTLSLQR